MSKMDLIELETKKLELETNKFELEQRRAKALSVSAFFPDQLKNDIASAVQIYDLSQRMDISVLEVAQSVYIIYGRPSFATTFLVARLNQSGKIKGALRTIVSKDNQKAYCTAIDAATGEELQGMEVTMAMADAEGWISKKGSKWKTMPTLMLRKRAQSFFIKEYFPEVMFGLQSSEEVQDIETVDVETIPTQGHDDLNAAISQKAQTTVAPPAQPQEAKAAEAPKTPAKRMPRFVSKMYFTLEQYGVKKHDLKKFAEYMDLEGMGESGVKEFFAQPPEEVTRYVNNFYGIETDAVDAEIEETTQQESDAESPNEPTPHTEAATQETSTQEPKAGIKLARYKGMMIGHGLKPEDCDDFFEWAQLNEENIGEFVDDLGGVDAAIEQFNAEMGYA